MAECLYVTYMDIATKTSGVLSNPVFIGLLSIIVSGYLLAILVFLYCDILKKGEKKWQKIQQQASTGEQAIFDVTWSLVSIGVWVVLAAFLAVFIESGISMVYFDMEKYGLAYFVVSTVGVIILHDTYFYWTHRFMHSGPKIYRWLHKTHHTNTNPTALTIYSFTPAEAIFLGLYAFLVTVLLPIHWWTLLILLAVNTVANILGHSGYELIPAGVANSRLGKKMCVGTHHNLHHQTGRYNFSIYFHFWDTLMNTMNPRYPEERGRMLKKTTL